MRLCKVSCNQTSGVPVKLAHDFNAQSPRRPCVVVVLASSSYVIFFNGSLKFSAEDCVVYSAG